MTNQNAETLSASVRACRAVAAMTHSAATPDIQGEKVMHWARQFMANPDYTYRAARLRAVSAPTFEEVLAGRTSLLDGLRRAGLWPTTGGPKRDTAPGGPGASSHCAAEPVIQSYDEHPHVILDADNYQAQLLRDRKEITVMFEGGVSRRVARSTPF